MGRAAGMSRARRGVRVPSSAGTGPCPQRIRIAVPDTPSCGPGDMATPAPFEASPIASSAWRAACQEPDPHRSRPRSQYPCGVPRKTVIKSEGPAFNRRGDRSSNDQHPTTGAGTRRTQPLHSANKRTYLTSAGTIVNDASASPVCSHQKPQAARVVSNQTRLSPSLPEQPSRHWP